MRCLHCHKNDIAPSVQVCPYCGVFLPELYRNLLPIGMFLNQGRYRIDDVLGRGGFGVTYRATHVALHKTVALKEFYPREHAARNTTTWQIIVGTQQQPLYERGLKRFEREGQTLAELRHPNIVGINHLFTEHNTAYLEMEFLEGHTLKEELMAAPEHRLDEARVRHIMASLVAALSVAHYKRIYHLDIKADNVMVEPTGRVVLIDFGAARRGLGTLSTQSFTPGYAPPELMSEVSDPGPESDIFELGMTLHELLTGTLPPDAMSRAMDQVRGILWSPDGLVEPWHTLLETALPLAREARAQDVREWWAKAMLPAAPPVAPAIASPGAPSGASSGASPVEPQEAPTELIAPPPEPPKEAPKEPQKRAKTPASQTPKPQRGADLRVEVTVTAAEARSGCRKAYATLEAGQGIVDIPPGARQGQQLRLTGRGQAGQHGGPAGDLIATVKVPSASMPKEAKPKEAKPKEAKIKALPVKVAPAKATPVKETEAPATAAPATGAPPLLLRVALPAGAMLLLLGVGLVWFGGKPQSGSMPAPTSPRSGPASAMPSPASAMPSPASAMPSQPAAQPVQVIVCTTSGLLPTAYCPRREKRSFAAGQEPHQRCARHTAATRAAATRQLVQGVTGGDTRLVTKALDDGADIETRLFKDGQTPLITAAANSNAPLVRLLLSRGARVGAQDDRGESALLEAAAQGYTATATALFAGGADKYIDLPSKEGVTPLIAAAAFNKPEMVHLLLAHKADVTPRDGSYHKTALQWTRSEAVKNMLRAHGASE